MKISKEVAFRTYTSNLKDEARHSDRADAKTKRFVLYVVTKSGARSKRIFAQCDTQEQADKHVRDEWRYFDRVLEVVDTHA